MAAKKRARGVRRLRPKSWPWWMAVGQELQCAVAVAESDSLALRLKRENVFAEQPIGPAPYSIVPRYCVDLHALGQLLVRIANGEDAREVFQQVPAKGWDSRQVTLDHSATLYWHWRNKGLTQAVAAARALKSWPTREGPPPKAKTLIKAAGKGKEGRINHVEGRTQELVGAALKPVVTVRGKNADKLRAGIKRSSHKGRGA